MKLQEGKYYLVATANCEKFGQRLILGDVVKTIKGRPRAFGTIERALNWKAMNLGNIFPVRARSCMGGKL